MVIFLILCVLISGFFGQPSPPPAAVATHPYSHEDDASQRVRRALLPKSLARLEPITSGFSGARAYRAVTHDGESFFAKVVLSWSDVREPDKLCAEFSHAAWLGERGLGPTVVISDAKQGVLITEFLPNEMSEIWQGGLEPRLSASLLTMRQLHQSDPPSEKHTYQLQQARQSWQDDLTQVPESDAHDPWIKVATRVAHASMLGLATHRYDAVLRHGDFHQENVMFFAGKARPIDWGSLNYGDAMQELAYYAYHIDVDIDGLDDLLGKYGPVSQQDVHRAKLHLTLMHAHRYLQTLRGMAWDLPEEREQTLEKLATHLAQDFTWLSATP